MKLFKTKLAWAAPVAVILIILLFSLNLFVQGNPTARNLPVGIAVQDEGAHVDAVLAAVEQMGTGVNGAEPMLRFVEVAEEDIDTVFYNKELYAAIVIPAGFNAAVENALENNESAKIKVYVNQGINVTGSNAGKAALTGLVQQIGAMYSASYSAELAGQTIPVEKAAVLVAPVVAEEIILNPITPRTANGVAPTLMAVPAWVGALIGGFILFLCSSSIQKKERLDRAGTLRLMLGQVLFGVIVALFSGFTVATLGVIAGINMPGYLLVALFVSFAAFCFFMLISAVTAWVGKPAITLFMVVMLLGMGVLMMPAEMLPDFFLKFIRPWIPLRFASEGLREIFYFGGGFYTGPSFNTVLGIGIGGLIVYALSVLKAPRKKAEEVPATAQSGSESV